jgi:hypothetical protein
VSGKFDDAGEGSRANCTGRALGKTGTTWRTVKTQQEIQRAHDLLVGVILGDVPLGLPERTMALICVQADVLCWLLEHDHDINDNVNFGECLKKVEAAALSSGYKLTDYGN